jgi:hypothetical protein
MAARERIREPRLLFDDTILAEALEALTSRPSGPPSADIAPDVFLELSKEQ